MLTPQQIARAVATLHAAERERVQVPALTLTYPGMDLEDAYAVQQAASIRVPETLAAVLATTSAYCIVALLLSEVDRANGASGITGQ